jgi:hypothetical protein
MTSLAEAGVKVEPIAKQVGGIHRGEYKNIHAVLIVRSGRMILKVSFQGYNRE